MLIPATKWEKLKKAEFQKTYKPFKKAVDEGVEKGYEFNDFSQDLYSSLYQYRPKWPEKSTPGAQWAKDAIDELKELPEFNQMRRANTQCNSLNSGLGATVLTKHYAKSLPKVGERNPDEAQKDVDHLQKLLDELKKKQDAGEKIDKKQIKDIKDKHAKASKDLQKSLNAWSKVQPDKAKIRQTLRKAIGTAQDEIDEIEKGLEAFGYGTEPGKDGYKNEAEKLAVAKKLENNPKLKEIAKLAGRFKREAKKEQANKKNPGVDEITDIEMGDEIGRLLPNELMKLRHPLLKKLFYKGYLEKSLMQYYMESKEQECRGPIIFCIDNSGSMVGEIEIWSKAICLSIAQISVLQKRTFEIIHFDNDVTRVDTFPKGKVDATKLVDSISYFSGGGTNFVRPLKRAFKDISTEALKKADIIFITDGQAPLADKDVEIFNKSKKVSGAQIYTICIGREATSLVPISDEIITIHDLNAKNADKEAKEIIFSI